MQFELTPQREAYFTIRGKVVLNACPGSGKTTCIIKKLPLLEKECLEKFGPYSGIACLSFTNKAKDEIQQKYTEVYGEHFKFPNIISTLDSFINNFITLPFYNLINKDFKRPKIVDSDEVIENALKTTYTNRAGKLVEGIQYPFNTFKDKLGKSIYRMYKPSDIWVGLNDEFSYKGKPPDYTKVDKTVFQNYGKALFQWKLRKGLLTGLDSAGIALFLLGKYERIGKWLSLRFPYILIDEAQDNSEIQHAIFDKLTTLDLSNIELIGDPYQSLYEWRDAKPKLFVEKISATGWTGLPLSQNRRSNQRIIDCFSILRLATDELIVSKDVLDLTIPITIYKYNNTNPSLIVSDFESTCTANNFIKNQIVVRGNDLKDKMLGKIASVEPWKTHIPLAMLNVKHSFETQNVKAAINEFRSIVMSLSNPGLEYHALKELEKNAKGDYIFNAKLYALAFKIPSVDLSLEDWSDQCKNLLREFAGNIDTYFEFKIKINGYKMADLKKATVRSYFNKSASANTNIPISTIHQIKGATLEALLCFFNENSIGQNISFKDFDRPVSFPSEKQRMIYVACSRPSQFLALAFPDKIPDTELNKKFGQNIRIIAL